MRVLCPGRTGIWSVDLSNIHLHKPILSAMKQWTDLLECSANLLLPGHTGGLKKNLDPNHQLPVSCILIDSSNLNLLRQLFLRILTAHANSPHARQMAIAIAFPGFNNLGRSVTPIFLLMDQFFYRFSTFSEKMKKIYRLEV